MKKIEYGTEFLDQLKDSVHDLYDRNQELLSSNVKLREEKIKLKGIIDKAIEYIEEKVGNEIHDMMYVIDVSDLLDILKGVDKE